MKKYKGLIIGGVIVLLLIIIIASIFGTYNGLVDKQTAVEENQATIETQLQRRADLIPNFVETVKGYANFEQSTLTAITEARSAVNAAKTGSELAEANQKLDEAISVFVNAVKEAYPDLKANQNFIALQDELAGTENRIANARIDYNKAVKTYNASIKKFPAVIIASMFGFDKADFFEASAGAENVPIVSFD